VSADRRWQNKVVAKVLKSRGVAIDAASTAQAARVNYPAETASRRGASPENSLKSVQKAQF
jgi:hypothetical protein